MGYVEPMESRESDPQNPIHVVVDTDVGTDDLIALAYLLCNRRVRVDAVTTVGGLSGARAGAEGVARLLTLSGRPEVPVLAGSEVPIQETRPFPAEWRKVSEEAPPRFLPPASGVRVDGSGGIELLARLFGGRHPVTVLALGPLTNVALALRRIGGRPGGAHRLVVMGGALDVPGNVADAAEPGTENGRAEWNFHVDPTAASEVLRSGLQVELVPLDATSSVPIDTRFADVVEQYARSPQARFVADVLGSVREWISQGGYFAWDPLAAVLVADPAVASFTSVPLAVDVEPPHEGWTRRDTANGVPVRVATTASLPRFTWEFLDVILEGQPWRGRSDGWSDG